MQYNSLRAAVNDLERNGMLLRIKEEVDPNLEIAAIHRQIFEQNGPAILFERVKGSPFQAVSNIYGTFDRTAFLFRHTLERVKRVIELKKDQLRFTFPSIAQELKRIAEAYIAKKLPEILAQDRIASLRVEASVDDHKKALRLSEATLLIRRTEAVLPFSVHRVHGI
jgi:UbiD family decarboxylase